MPPQTDPEPGPPHRIVLCGFMGAGKSTVGRLLAESLRWPFADLDDVIECAAGQTVAQIFAGSGEPAFRALEQAALRAELEKSPQVLALGGGALDAEANRRLILAAPHTLVVHLQASFAQMQSRCAADRAHTRPNFADAAAAASRFHLRSPFYDEVATLSVATDRLSPSQVVTAILDAHSRAFTSSLGSM